jgi:hypothetical protein
MDFKMKRIAFLLVFYLSLSSISIAQSSSYYKDALRHLQTRLPKELGGSSQNSFQIQEGFAKISLNLFQEELADTFSPSQIKKLKKSSRNESVFPKSLLQQNDFRSNLRLQFSAANKEILIVKLENLRPFASNPKIEVDNQVIETWYLLFNFSPSGNIIKVFSKRF